MSKDVRTFLLALAGMAIAVILLGSLVRAGETWAVPVIIVLAVLGFVGLRVYQKRRQAEKLQELRRPKQAGSKQIKGG